MKNILFRYLLALVLFTSTGGIMKAQNLVIDHKTRGKLGEEIAAALVQIGGIADNITKVTITSNTSTPINANDVREMKAIVKKVQEFDFSQIMTEGFDASMFQGYLTLVKISLPSNITVIPSYCFQSCSNLTTIEGWDGIKKIGEKAFMDCVKFNSLSLPPALEEVGNNAFRNCTALTVSTLPDGLKKIGRQGFRSTNVTFSKWPSAIELVDNRAFCITKVTFDTWPKNIPVITAGVFINCSTIKDFIIPATVTSVGGAAFRLAENIARNIYLSSDKPLLTLVDDEPEGGNSSDNPFGATKTDFSNQSNTILHIPASGKQFYQAATYWKAMKYATQALSSTTLSGTWTKAELEAMDITDANLTDIDMTGITVPVDVALSGATNPNLLVYAKASDNITVDKGFIVKDGQIDNLVLTDLKPFNPSKSISVGSISYNRPATAAFETICLPFDAVVPSGCDVMELSGGTSEQVSLNKVSAMAANTPYMILKSTAESYFFSAAGQTVSNEMKTVTTDAPYDFKGTYLLISITAEEGEKVMYISDGKEFRLTGKGASILPFRAFLEGEVRGEANPVQAVKIARTVGVGKGVQGSSSLNMYSSNGILYMNTTKTMLLNIYGIDGRLVRSEMLNEGENEITGLCKGVYIVENNKVVVE